MTQIIENHLFDFDTNGGLVVLGLNVPRELRFTPVHKKGDSDRSRKLYPISDQKRKNPKKNFNLLVIVGSQAELKQPVKGVIGEVYQGATRRHHDSLQNPKTSKSSRKNLLENHPPQNSCNF